jgi:ubiquinone/menaquinone biosynthesis C-methylase UbiE
MTSPPKGDRVDFERPSWAFLLFDGILAPRIFASFYRAYADSIELDGTEAVLEFGCGSGGAGAHLVPRLPSGSLTCVDISAPMLAIAQKRLARFGNVRFLCGRIEELPLESGSFDAVVIHNALHDVASEERAGAVTALSGLLRVGGRLWLREPTKEPHGLAPDEYRRLMRHAGLRQEKAREYKAFPNGPVFDAVFVKDSAA